MSFPTTARTILAGLTVGVALMAAPAASDAVPAAPADVPAASVFVSSGLGSDSNSGARSAPVKSVNQAVKLVGSRAGTIALLPGDYPALRFDAARTAPLTISSAGEGRANVAGITVFGASKLTFSDLRITQTVNIFDDVFHVRGASEIVLENSEITTGGGPQGCVLIRNLAQQITIRGNTIHDCLFGIAGPGSSRVSTDIVIDNNDLRGFVADGIQVANWNRFRISNNAISDISDPQHLQHNDAIQLMGNIDGAEIVSNRISDSDHQLIIMQAAVGPINDVLVRENTIFDAGGYAVQTSGVTNAQFVQNTIWNGYYGGLLLRAGQYRDANGMRAVPKDTVLDGNVLQTVGFIEGAEARVVTNNLVGCKAPLQSDCLTAGSFVAPTAGDYRLAAALSSSRTGASSSASTSTWRASSQEPSAAAAATLPAPSATPSPSAPSASSTQTQSQPSSAPQTGSAPTSATMPSVSAAAPSGSTVGSTVTPAPAAGSSVPSRVSGVRVRLGKVSRGGTVRVSVVSRSRPGIAVIRLLRRCGGRTLAAPVEVRGGVGRLKLHPGALRKVRRGGLAAVAMVTVGGATSCISVRVSK